MIWQRKDEDKIHLLPILNKTTPVSSMELLLLVIPLYLLGFFEANCLTQLHALKISTDKNLYKEMILKSPKSQRTRCSRL